MLPAAAQVRPRPRPPLPAPPRPPLTQAASAISWYIGQKARRCAAAAVLRPRGARARQDGRGAARMRVRRRYLVSPARNAHGNTRTRVHAADQGGAAAGQGQPVATTGFAPRPRAQTHTPRTPTHTAPCAPGMLLRARRTPPRCFPLHTPTLPVLSVETARGRVCVCVCVFVCVRVLCVRAWCGGPEERCRCTHTHTHTHTHTEQCFRGGSWRI